MIVRDLEKEIRERINKGKTIVIYGARQVGKTTLLHQIFDDKEGVKWFNGDDSKTQEAFSRASLTNLAPVVSGYKTIIIDEAQKISDIGLKLKILQDNLGREIQFIATGSSSFDLANKISEPMTGRKWTYRLFAPSVSELVRSTSYFDEKNNLEHRLIFGSYPDVVTNLGDAERILNDYVDESLYKDVFKFEGIIKTEYLRNILQALALQIGSQVNYSELSNLIGLDRKTIEKYIALLEQSFIIFRLPSFSRNMRNELKHSRKIYFYDTGVRNAILGDYRPLSLRQDDGALFENYIVSELKKFYPTDNIYFWRNTNQQEIDFVLEKNGELNLVEVKKNPKKKVKTPGVFERSYHPASFTVINSDNYLDYFLNHE